MRVGLQLLLAPLLVEVPLVLALLQVVVDLGFQSLTFALTFAVTFAVTFALD